MNATNNPFKTSLLSAAVTLALGLSVNVSQAAQPLPTTGNNFTMLKPYVGQQGGTNDVVFSWDETFRFSPAVSGNVSNATLSSVTPFSSKLWTAHDVTIYAPGTYTFEVNCPAGEPGCVSTTTSYLPKRNFNGSDSFTYIIVDARGGAAIGTVNVTVNPVNDAPVVNKDLLVTSQGNTSPVSINPLLNDSDVEGNTLSVTAITQGVNGSVVLVSPISVSYTPTGSFFGIDSFTYTASDGNGGNTVGTVYVGVNKTGNSAPVVSGSPAVLSVPEDGSNFITASANVTDSNGDTLTPLFATNGAKCDGGINIAPPQVSCSLFDIRAKDFNGTDNFTYVVTDGNGGVVPVTVSVTVTPVNDAPVAKPDALITSQGNTVAVTINPLLNDIDVDNDSLIVSSVTQAVHGSVTFTNTDVTYRSTDTSFSGIDSFTYTVNDGTVNSTSGWVNVAVNATGNNPPLAVNDSIVVNEDSGAGSVLAVKNDSDPDNDKLRVIMAVSPAANGASNFTVSPTLTITVDIGQVGGHMLFDWGDNLNIDVVNVWKMNSKFGTGADLWILGGGSTTDPWSAVATNIWDGASTDDDGDGVPGAPMLDGGFSGFNANFNLMGLRPLAPLIAAAGPDANAVENTLVTLTGTCSHVDVPVTACDWSSSDLTLTPGTVTGLNSHVATRTASFTAPAATDPYTPYSVTLTATDSLGTPKSDSKKLTVTPYIPPASVANAGAYQSVVMGNGVTLTGTCTAAETNITGCVWSTFNPAIVLTLAPATGLGSRSAAATATFTAPMAASNTAITFKLTAVDDNNLTANGADHQIVTVMTAASAAGAPTATGVPNEKSQFGCSISPQPAKLAERGEWWLLAGFMTWLGGWRYRRRFGGKR